MPSAVEPPYLRFVATFGTESRYCKMPVDSLAAAQGGTLGQAMPVPQGEKLALRPPPGLGHPALPATLV